MFDMLLLQQMIILFLLMMVGFALNKCRIIDSTGAKALSAVVVNVANPAMVLSAAINKESVITGMELLKTIGLIVLIYVILLLLAWVVTKVLRVTVGQCGTYKNMTVFSNLGFMGFPLVNAMFGSDALLYASLFTIPYNILIYTYAYRMMDRDIRELRSEGSSIEHSAQQDSSDTSGQPETSCHSERSDGSHSNPSSCHSERSEESHSLTQFKKILNIGVISCIVAIIIYLTRIPMPKFIETTVGHLSNLTAPLSMIVIGSAMADMKFKEMFTDVRLLIFSAIKLLVIPVVGVMLIRLTGASTLFVGVSLIMLGTPVGSMTAMVAQTHGSNYELAARGVALTTVLSVITLPIVSMIL